MLGHPLGRRSIVILGLQKTGIIHVAEWRDLEPKWSDVVDTARKAEGARYTMYLIPSPPSS